LYFEGVGKCNDIFFSKMQIRYLQIAFLQAKIEPIYYKRLNYSNIVNEFVKKIIFRSAQATL